VFRQLLISEGIDAILHLQETDIIQFASCTAIEMKSFMVFIFMPIIALIGLIDPREGDTYGIKFNQLCASPREAIRVFHRRSSCSCLKDLYYNLKDNCSKKTWYNYCGKTSDVKTIFECDCEMTTYCSRECAKSDWTRHKCECMAYKGR
jgi:hypothetical protein